MPKDAKPTNDQQQVDAAASSSPGSSASLKDDAQRQPASKGAIPEGAGNGSSGNASQDSGVPQMVSEKIGEAKTAIGDAGYKLVENAKAAKSNLSFQHQMEELADIREQWEKAYNSSWYKRVLSAPISKKKLPWPMVVFGILCCLGAIAGGALAVFDIVQTVQMFQDGRMDLLGTSTIVVTFVSLVDIFLICACFLIFGIRLFRNQRVYAALVIYALYVLLLIGACCSLMLYGVGPRLIIYVAATAILVAFQAYLDPHLREERHLRRMMKDKEIKEEQEEGVLGRDLTGKGFIDLNFFNLFWIFVVASMVGDGMETLFHIIFVDPGHYQDRAGLLFGPFSPIYGCGAVLMTLFLNKMYNKNILWIFLMSAIIGGAFEYFVSWWMQYTYGAVAWNYTGQFLSIDGRTCGLAMAAWGALGVIWIKLLLPFLVWLIGKIPWNWRYGITVAATALMIVDCVMSLEALDCWYERLAGRPIDTPIQHFYADYFNNDYMANRFQSMTIDPHTAVRGGK